MIDTFSLALTHGLLMLTAWLLFRRRDLDSEAPSSEDEGAGRRRRWGGRRA